MSIWMENPKSEMEVGCFAANPDVRIKTFLDVIATQVALNYRRLTDVFLCPTDYKVFQEQEQDYVRTTTIASTPLGGGRVEIHATVSDVSFAIAVSSSPGYFPRFYHIRRWRENMNADALPILKIA